MKQPKEQRFQLFLHEMHEPTAASAARNGRTLSSEVRHRVKRSFVLDDLLAFIEKGIEREATCRDEIIAEIALTEVRDFIKARL